MVMGMVTGMGRASERRLNAAVRGRRRRRLGETEAPAREFGRAIHKGYDPQGLEAAAAWRVME
jgi:hypothetical protein